MPAVLSVVASSALQGSRCDAAIGASALELAQLRLGGGRAGGVTLFAALSALGGTVDEDAMRNVVIGAALGLQVCVTALARVASRLHSAGWTRSAGKRSRLWPYWGCRPWPEP